METMCGVTMDYPSRLNDIVGCDGLGDVVEASTDVVYQLCFVFVYLFLFFVLKKKIASASSVALGSSDPLDSFEGVLE